MFKGLMQALMLRRVPRLPGLPPPPGLPGFAGNKQGSQGFSGFAQQAVQPQVGFAQQAQPGDALANMMQTQPAPMTQPPASPTEPMTAQTNQPPPFLNPGQVNVQSPMQGGAPQGARQEMPELPWDRMRF